MGARKASRHWRVAGILTIVAIATLLLGVAPALAEDSPSPSAAPSTTLRVGWTAQPNSTNPFTGNLICEYEINHLNYDLLVGFAPGDLSPRPELATSWTNSADGLTWTFKIREGVKWSDGQPLTAKDVAFTFNYIVKNQISGYTMFTPGIKDAVATDDYTVVITCEFPKANILGMWVPIVPEHIWSSIKPEDAGGKYPNNPPVVGSGPFQTVEFVRGRYVKLQANPYSWRDKTAVQEIIFNSYKNPVTMADEMKSGALDVCWDIPDAQFPILQKTAGITVIDGQRKGFEELGFNCYAGAKSKGNPVLKDWKFRQALNWAVDKQKILDVAWLGHGTVATSVVQPGYFPASADMHWEPPADLQYTFDLTKAGAMLDAAGYPLKDGVRIVAKTGKPVGKLRLVARSNSAQSQRAGKLIAGWFSELGLQIDYQVLDEATLLAGQYNFEGDVFVPDYDMFIWDWVGLGVDPNFILSVFLTKQIAGWSDSMYSNTEYDKLYDLQARTVDPQKRKAIVWQMQEMLWKETPYITLVYATNLEAYNNKWEGWVRSPEGAGGIIYNADNIDSYVSVHPVTPKTEETTKSSSNTGLIIGIVIAVVVVAIAVIVFFMLRRRRTVEE
jgi:peptide/nickel transport system substrate-binding protein